MVDAFKDEPSVVLFGIILALVVGLMGIVQGSLGLTESATKNWELATIVLGSLAALLITGGIFNAFSGNVVPSPVYVAAMAFLGAFSLCQVALAAGSLGGALTPSKGGFTSEICFGCLSIILLILTELFARYQSEDYSPTPSDFELDA